MSDIDGPRVKLGVLFALSLLGVFGLATTFYGAATFVSSVMDLQNTSLELLSTEPSNFEQVVGFVSLVSFVVLVGAGTRVLVIADAYVPGILLGGSAGVAVWLVFTGKLPVLTGSLRIAVLTVSIAITVVATLKLSITWAKSKDDYWV